jgi:hypothetical protein
LHRTDTNSLNTREFSSTLNTSSSNNNNQNLQNNTSNSNSSNNNNNNTSNNISINSINNTNNSNMTSLITNNQLTNINNNLNKITVFWENSSNKLILFNDWNDGFNEWHPMHPYPPLKSYLISLNKRRNAKHRIEIEFDEQLGLYLPTFKIIQKQLQLQQQLQHQQQEQLQQLQQQSLNTYHHHVSAYSSQNHPSTRLIKELHKLVNANNTNTVCTFSSSFSSL